MTKIRWKSSPTDRGNVTMVDGGIYDTDELEKPIDKDSYREWKKEGVFEEISDEETPIVEAEEEPQKEDFTLRAKPEEPVTVKELDMEGTEVEKQPSFPKDAIEFPCPHDDCNKHPKGKGYKIYWQFLKHMKDKHGELWKVEDDNIVKQQED